MEPKVLHIHGTDTAGGQKSLCSGWQLRQTPLFGEEAPRGQEKCHHSANDADDNTDRYPGAYAHNLL
ncbi:MAG: hypothetical protein U1U88_000487 [Lawsonella clevelandensis]